jgi:uncharacterized RDD family membrane protein YckC
MTSPTEVPPEITLGEALRAARTGFGIRFGARLLDLVIIYVLGLITGFGSGLLFAFLHARGLVASGWVERLQQPGLSIYAFALLGAYLYHSLSEGLGGTTLGKLVCDLRVVQKDDGRPCTMAAAFKRDLAYYWDALFFGLVAYSSMSDSPLYQRYGDKWAGTVVVDKDDFTAAARPSGEMVAVGILTGSGALLLCQFAGLALRLL